MRRVMLLILSLVVLNAFAQVPVDKETARELLKQEIEATNNLLNGQQIDVATVSDGCHFCGDVIHYYYTVDETYLTIEAMSKNSARIKQNQKEMFKANVYVQEMLGWLRAVDGKILFHYLGNITGERLVIEIKF